MCGAATGIGAATAARLGAEGARLVLGDLSTEGVEGTAERVREAGGEAEAVWFDLADEASIRAL